MTDAQFKALRWIAERGGSAQIDRYGGLVAGGELLSSSFCPTLLRLCAMRLLEGRRPNRLVLTRLGMRVASMERLPARRGRK